MRIAMLAAAAVAAQALTLHAVAQPASIPRTAEGRPDLHGVWFSGYMTQLERPEGFDAFIIPPDQKEAAIAKMVEWFSEGEVYDPELDSNPVPRALLEIDGQMRSSWLVEPADGKLPLTALAAAVMDAPRSRYDNPEERPSPERCLGGLAQAPLVASAFPIPLQIVQTPEAMVLAAEDFNPVRIVSMSAGQPHDALRTPDGHSRGRWEGDTLVIETTHFAVPRPSTGLMYRSAAPITADSRVIERFQMQSPDRILYRFTVEDPALYKAPWLAEFVLNRVDMGFFEYACHEGNHAIINVLTAARLGLQEQKPD